MTVVSGGRSFSGNGHETYSRGPDGAADLKSTDDVCARALYKVVLARETEAGGDMSHVDYLDPGKNRLGVARGLIRSAELETPQ